MRASVSYRAISSRQHVDAASNGAFGGLLRRLRQMAEGQPAAPQTACEDGDSGQERQLQLNYTHETGLVDRSLPNRVTSEAEDEMNALRDSFAE